MVHRFKKETTNYQLPTTNKRRRRSGLTLIELLVVIAILGILASFTSVAMIGHQKKARDAQRKSDMTQFAQAMESAKNDCRNTAYYPKPTAFSSGSLWEPGRFSQETTHLSNSNLKYLPNTLKDPLNSGTSFYRFAIGPITVTNNCPTIALVVNGLKSFEYWVARAPLEITNDPDSTKSYNNCSTTITLVIANGGNYGFDLTYLSAPAQGDGFFYVCSI